MDVDETMDAGPETLRRLLDEARAELAGARENWERLQQERDEARKAIRDVVTQLEEARRQRDGSWERLRRATDEVAELRSLVVTARKERDRLVSGFTCERARARENRERLQQERDEARGAIRDVVKQLDEARRQRDEIKRSTTRPSDDELLARLERSFTAERAAALEAIDLMIRMDGGFKDRIGTEEESDEDISTLCHHERLIGYAMALKRAADEVQSERMPF